MRSLRIVLLPFTWLYVGILSLRHLLFDLGILHSKQADIQTIVVGNLELGGTGKSPHSLWVLKQLSSETIAVLSRGHGRKTEGFLSVDVDADADEVGDEPLMLKQSVPHVKVAVCEDRLDGIKELASEGFKTVVLDDAFQHRSLKAGLNVLLTPYNLPFWKNHVLPTGTLRDVKSRAKAAHILIISKCPAEISQVEMDALRKKASLYTKAKVYFSCMRFGIPQAVFPHTRPWIMGAEVLAVSGLAHNDAFFEKVDERFQLRNTLGFSDHHRYTQKDLLLIRQRLSNFVGPLKAVLTTSKDAAKLGKKDWMELSEGIDLYSLPMEVEIIADEEELISELKTYVR
jgi:tetraacyldisaccharide 4'-kinase